MTGESGLVCFCSRCCHLVPAVKELVVSAGKSVQITLPKNEVQLNAYVLPEPEQGKLLGNTIVFALVAASFSAFAFETTLWKTGCGMWAHKSAGSTGGDVLYSWRAETLLSLACWVSHMLHKCFVMELLSSLGL